MSEQQLKELDEEKTTYRIEGFSCANCAGKFENNVRNLPDVQDAKVNFGASKISIQGTASIEELEKAGAFENLKVMPEKPKRREPEIIKDKNVYHVNGFSCAHCAGKFENNVKKLSNVHDAKVDYRASKIAVYGEASIEELENAGSVENLEVRPEKPTRTPVAEDEPKEDKIPFYKKHSTLLYSALFMALGFLSMAVNG